MPDLFPTLQPPWFDTSKYPEYVDTMRKQQLAAMLMQNTQQSAQNPQDWNSMRIVPRRSALSNVATLASALMAGRSLQGANQATQQYFTDTNPQPAPAPQAPPPPSAPGLLPPNGIPGSQGPPGPGSMAQSGPSVPIAQVHNSGDPAQGLATVPASSVVPAATPPRNPMIPPGMDARTAQGFMQMMGPAEYGKAAMAQYAPTDIEKQLRAAQIDPASPLGQGVMRMVIGKATSDTEAVRQGTGVYNKYTGQFDAYNPVTAPGSVPSFQGGQPTGISTLPGAVSATEQADAAAARGKAAGTPTIVTGSGGTPIATFPAAGAIGRTANGSAISQAPVAQPPAVRASMPAGAPPLNPPSTNHIMSPTEAKANEGLAQQAVTNYQAMNEKASAAVNALRNTSEMKNLMQGFNPSKAAGALASVGNIGIAFGMGPQHVAELTNVDPGNVEAFEKNTAALASEVVKEFTNRTTQMEFSTFMKNNPNPLMTPGGLKRVIDFMEKGLNSTIDQQQEAQQFWQANQTRPERFVTDFPAYYNAKKAGQIKTGQFDSLNPSLSPIRTRADVNAAAASQGTIKVTPGMDIQTLKQQHPPGTVFEFPDGSRGKL